MKDAAMSENPAAKIAGARSLFNGAQLSVMVKVLVLMQPLELV
jgi:hypothetical protein